MHEGTHACMGHVWCTHAKSLQSCPTLCDPWTVVHQAPLSMGFSRQEHWSELPCPSPGDLPHPGIKPESLISPANWQEGFLPSTTWEALFTYADSIFFFLQMFYF